MSEPHPVSDRPLAGIMLMAAGVSILPLMDGIAKYLVADFPVMQVVWARFAFHLLWILPLLMIWLRPSDLWPRRPVAQLVRSAFLLAATLCFFAAIRYMPIADALALLFVSPMICTLLSPLVLGERVGPWRWAAVVAGFAGALIVIRPGFGVFHWASLLALSAGVLHGLYLLGTRVLAGSGRPHQSSPPWVTLRSSAQPWSVTGPSAIFPTRGPGAELSSSSAAES